MGWPRKPTEPHQGARNGRFTLSCGQAAAELLTVLRILQRSTRQEAWLSAGSDRGRHRAAAMYSLVTAKLNDIDPRTWLADVLRRIADYPPRGSMS